jgi:hypothetical protein
MGAKKKRDIFPAELEKCFSREWLGELELLA